MTRSSVLDAKLVVNRVTQLLFATQITLGSLNRSVPKQELDLLQFAACDVTQAGTGTP
jgi:hypothetical protein